MAPFPCVREIPLTQGKFALVDNEDYQRVRQFKWHFHSGGYAARCFRIWKDNGEPANRTQLMHRLILPDANMIDHINRNKLDNRKCNLRETTKSINGHNTDNQYTGINWDNRRRHFVVRVCIGYRTHYVGSFETLENAQLARILFRRQHGLDA
jgi:hypothetical protein